MPSPTHAPQGTTWPGTRGGTNAAAGDAVFTPPAQLPRVRSLATEVNFTDTGGKPLTWTNLRPGTYLIESGTEPSIQGPMGLYGVLVVTEPDDTSGTTPAHVAYGTKFDAAVPLLLQRDRSGAEPRGRRSVVQHRRVQRDDGLERPAGWLRGRDAARNRAHLLSAGGQLLAAATT